MTGFPAKALLVKDGKVSGIRTAEKGLGRNGEKQGNFEPSVDIEAKVTVLGEGTRGFLSRSFFHWQNIRSENPQIYALGVKEIWEVKSPLDSVVHTMGWPLPSKLFGGSFMYPMDEKTISIGLVVGLNYADYSLDPHALFQLMKTHKLFKKYLESGERIEWGAKTIPEGGYYSVPERLSS
ncbi:MAG: electron transfer flavoprotein, partial [Candidatus Aenigmarchaeota archaeon]|nr:electron transfer flavoprotein [Candidatus Aenigmarchaeota archaeon]